MARTIFITGGTGFIGRALVAALVGRGDGVVLLSRDAVRARARLARALSDAQLSRIEVVEGNPACAGPWQERVAGSSAVINLAGESVGAHRWNAQVRQIIRDSRIDATRRVVEAIAAAAESARPRVLASASGIDYYPFDVNLGEAGLDDDGRPSGCEAAAGVPEGGDEVDESAPPGSGFLSVLCREWEAEATRAQALGVRVVLMRTGLVTARPGQGSSIDRWAAVFRGFGGGRLGTGRQWMSWVHLDDVVGAYLFAIDTPAVTGPVNLVAPGRMRNARFARALGRALGRPSWLPAPAFAMRAALGEFADYLLHGRPAVPRALLRAGYTFQRDQPF